MRTGIFGGSFDPVHIEHVKAAEAAIKSLRLDRLFVLPAYVPPHKRGRVLADDCDRLEMLRIAFANVKGAIVSDYEIRRAGVSYTYLTCRRFREEFPDDELFFLTGTDMLRDFYTWKNPDDILSNATLAVCSRAEKDADWKSKEEERFFARFQKKFVTIDYEASAVSSTQARVFAAAGEDISQFCGTAVAQYVKRKGLYVVKNAHEALANEKPERRAHSLRVACAAAKKAAELHIDEKKAVTAALFHDCAKNLSADSPLLEGFSLESSVPTPIPPSVLHQFTGAYVAERVFGVTDEEVLDAVRYHTSGRKGMGLLEQLIFLADMVEDGRSYEGADTLRSLYYAEKDGLDLTTYTALRETLYFLEKKGGEIYPFTREAFEYFKERIEKRER